MPIGQDPLRFVEASGRLHREEAVIQRELDEVDDDGQLVKDEGTSHLVLSMSLHASAPESNGRTRMPF
jgi:hypothetical protein